MLRPGAERGARVRAAALIAAAAALVWPAACFAHERWVPNGLRFPINRLYFQRMSGEVLLFSAASALAKMAESVQGDMPPRENPRLNTSIDSVHASGPLGRVHVLLHGNCNYKQTGLMQAWAAMNLLQQSPRRAG